MKAIIKIDELDHKIESWFNTKSKLDYEYLTEKEKLHPSDFMSAMLKISSMMNESSNLSARGEHDIIYICDIRDLKEDITEEDIIYLIKCGVHYEDECLCMFT